MYRKAGQAEDGLNALAGALMVMDKSGECHSDAELYRLKGRTDPAVERPEFRVEGQRSRSMFSEGHRHCQKAKCEVAGAASSNGFESAVASAGQSQRSTPNVS